MSGDLVPFDYSALGIAADVAGRLEFFAAQVEAGHRAAIDAMLRAAKALSEARTEFPGDLEFGRWREARLPWLSANMASQYLNVWRCYGSNPEFALDARQGRVLQTSATVLRMLAQPAADDIRPQVEDRLRAGQKVTAREIERLKAEAQAERAARLVAEEARAKLASEFDEFQRMSQSKKEGASRREANLIGDRDAARDEAAATRAELERRVTAAVQEAQAEADRRYQATIKRLTRDADEARAAAATRTEELDKAVARAREEAEDAARAHADVLAAEALASHQSKIDRLRREAEKLKAKKERTESDLQRIERMAQEHRDYLAKIHSADQAAKDQSELAGKLAKALNDAMLELADLESEPQPVAMRQLSRAAEMCRKMADAIEGFLAPKLASNVVTLHP